MVGGRSKPPRLDLFLIDENAHAEPRHAPVSQIRRHRTPQVNYRTQLPVTVTPSQLITGRRLTVVVSQLAALPKEELRQVETMSHVRSTSYEHPHTAVHLPIVVTPWVARQMWSDDVEEMHATYLR